MFRDLRHIPLCDDKGSIGSGRKPWAAGPEGHGAQWYWNECSCVVPPETNGQRYRDRKNEHVVELAALYSHWVCVGGQAASLHTMCLLSHVMLRNNGNGKEIKAA